MLCCYLVGLVRCYKLSLVVSLGFGVCLLSLLAGIVLGLFDKRADKIDNKRNKGEGIDDTVVWPSFLLPQGKK